MQVQIMSPLQPPDIFLKENKEFVFGRRWHLECPPHLRQMYPHWRFRSRALSSVGWLCRRRLTSLRFASLCLSEWRHLPSSGLHSAARSLLWLAFLQDGSIRLLSVIPKCAIYELARFLGHPVMRSTWVILTSSLRPTMTLPTGSLPEGAALPSLLGVF